MSHKQITNTDGSTNYKYTWYCTPQFTSYFSIFTLSTVCIWIYVLCFCAREVLASHHCGQASILPFESVKWPSSSTCNLGKNHLLRPGGVIKYFADDRCIVANKGTWGWKHQDVLFPPHRREPSYMAFFVPKVNVSARGIAWNSKHSTKIIWNPRYRVSQLAFLIIAHIAWRASNQLGHCVPERFNMGGILLFCSKSPQDSGQTHGETQVLFHEFTHVQSDHGILHAKVCFRQGFAELRLSNTWRPMRICHTYPFSGRILNLPEPQI